MVLLFLAICIALSQYVTTILCVNFLSYTASTQL